MNSKYKKFLIPVFLVASFIAMFSVGIKSVQAATSGEYALKTVGESTDNVDLSGGSYVVTGDPGQKIKVKLGVYNKASDKRNFLVNANTAYTTDNGALAYDKTKVSDPNLKVQTRKYVSPNSAAFTVPGKTTATLTFTVTIPKEKYSGYLMGGFNVSPS
ncbi:WxL protein peptidoglycan domain-containing protein [Companilactobacillus hulinensis]|uniref:WxL protein peptidoglycan domain-containing protein n=1 Tax=Companilactobacillus hulinensis TaxID=2486007 RepID=UPI000F7700F8|nr:DUF916 domain-containing protein [Companilactobacillus hulinensis]